MQTPPIVADLTAAVAAMDRACVKVVARLIERRDDIAAQTGVTADVWLANQTALPRWQRRALLQAADVLPHLPATWNAWQDGALSWEVVRRVVGEVARVGRRFWPEADGIVAEAADSLNGAEPDWVFAVLSDWLDQVDLARRAKAEECGEAENWLLMQPRLDGSGGRLVADYSAVPYAAITDAIAAAAPTPDDLVANAAGDVDATRHNRQSIAAAHAEGLLKLCSTNRDGAAKRPLLLATVPLETLLGMSDEGARLLTTLSGGQLRITASAARRLRDRFGALDVRLLIGDEAGATVGIGRIAHDPPLDVRQSVLAQHPTCTFPGCNRPARRSQLDHARPWTGGGRTDADNLHPLCAVHHTLKTRADQRSDSWQVVKDPDGTVMWTHPSGLRHEQPSLPRLRALARRRT